MNNNSGQMRIPPANGLLERAETITDPIQLADRILRAGLFVHASDVHIDPMEGWTRVRFRVDGVLEEVLRLPAAMHSSLVSRLKVLSSLDIAERRAPQDGGFSWSLAQMPNIPPLDVRMATLPCRHGERVTLRLLETGGRRLELDDIGLSPRDREVFEKILHKPHGLFLLTGPTGSGKTTTLYATINELLKGEAKNIITVEDPIEYEIPGVAQAEIDSADKVNFSKALKSILRHDPDVVMIGEIRDAASLDAAVKASLTGHLVLSTLHTNDAKSTIERLVDMGLDEKMAYATLRLAVAQRLVRRLCRKCSQTYTPDEAELSVLGLSRAAGTPEIKKACGCEECGGRGYAGRIGLFELFEPGGPEYGTMRDDARAKVLDGVTSIPEVVKAIGR